MIYQAPSVCPVCSARGTHTQKTLQEEIANTFVDGAFVLRYSATCRVCQFVFHYNDARRCYSLDCVEKDVIQSRRRRRRDRDPTNLVNCGHANEAPNVCPCPSTCNCNVPGGMCERKPHSYDRVARFDTR